MVKRPRNRVTDRMDELRHGADFAPELPVLTEEQVARLEDLYPDRVMKRGEDRGDHDRYAGKVELIADLRTRLEASGEADEELDIERAS